MFTKIFIFFFLTSTISLFAGVKSSEIYIVNANALKVRLAPTTKSQHSYNVYKNYKIRVYEIKGKWARVSKYNKNTSKAKWVYKKFITKASKKTTKQRLSIKQKVILKQALSYSDNYEDHASLFQIVSKKLIDKGRCKIRDFKRMRGWVESSPKNIYFTYCGGFRRSDKLYLNVLTGEIIK